MLKFENYENKCIYCKRKLHVKSIVRNVTTDLQEIEFIDSHKICRRNALTIAFLEGENRHLMDRIKKNDKSIVDIQYKMFLKSMDK